jgi:hypothetical protein
MSLSATRLAIGYSQKREIKHIATTRGLTPGMVADPNSDVQRNTPSNLPGGCSALMPPAMSERASAVRPNSAAWRSIRAKPNKPQF